MAELERQAAGEGASLRDVLQYCKPFKDRYDRCFNAWYRQGFLQGQLTNTCDDQFEDFRACVLEEMAARGLRFAGASEVPPELRRR
mmetsp:Transcript_116266/g.323857  ORF Transcript_116266/g.323857 Transcript_116266/m.323857 type:complete len:86 (+) Transcript_116266:161-418(+)